MKKSFPLLALFIIAAQMAFMPGCSGGGKGGTLPGGNDVASYSQEVGPDGGTVTDPRGAVIIIPAGALDAKTTITVKTYADRSTLTNRIGLNPCAGGVDFGPDGLVFKKPATITIPSDVALVPGQHYPLYVYNESKKVWQETDFYGVASADGTSLTAEILHFSFYVVLEVPRWTLEIFKHFYSWGFVDLALANYRDWFLENTDFDGYTVQKDDKNYTICGMNFHVMTRRGSDTEQAVISYGDTSTNIATYTSANLSDDYMDSNGNESVIDLLITMYWKETDQDPSDKLKIGLVEPADGSTVSGMVTVGGFTKKAVKAEFYVNGAKVNTDTEAPFSFEWITDSGSYPDGSYAISARAYDKDNNHADSETVTVTVANETNPAAIEFSDTDYRRGKAGGDITITRAPDEDGFDSYVLYWGDINRNRLLQIDEIPKTGSDILYTLPDGTAIPSGARTLLLFTKSSSKENNTDTSTAFNDLWDEEPPVPGTGGYTFTHVSDRTLSLHWPEAEDNQTVKADLQYKAVSSLSANINTVNDAENNGTLVKDWTANITSVNVQASTFDQNTYYAVLVKDEAGNKACYSLVAVPIVELACSPPAEATYMPIDSSLNNGFSIGPADDFAIFVIDPYTSIDGTYTYNISDGILHWDINSTPAGAYNEFPMFFVDNASNLIFKSCYPVSSPDFGNISGSYSNSTVNYQVGTTSYTLIFNADGNYSSELEEETGTWLINNDNTITVNVGGTLTTRKYLWVFNDNKWVFCYGKWYFVSQ